MSTLPDMSNIPGVAERGTRPLRLARLTRSEAQARSALAARVNECPFEWLDQEWLLTLSPMPLGDAEGAAQVAQADDLVLGMAWGGAPFTVTVPRTAVSAWLAASFEGLEVEAPPDDYLPALLEAACAPLLAQLTQLQQGEASLESLGPSAQMIDMPHQFAWSARSGEHVVRGRLGATSLGLMMMAGAVAQRPAALNRLQADALPVRLRAEIGFTWLQGAQIRALGVGDAVLLEHAFISPDREIWLSTGDWGLRAHLGDEGFTVTAAFTREEFTMPEVDMNAGDEQLSALDAAPLRLSFDLGERLVSLGELRRLQVGELLELGRPLAAAVHMRVNGALVGMGELVDIDGRLGVSITSISPGQAPAASAGATPQGEEEDERHEDDEADDDWEEETATNA